MASSVLSNAASGSLNATRLLVANRGGANTVGVVGRGRSTTTKKQGHSHHSVTTSASCSSSPRKTAITPAGMQLSAAISSLSPHNTRGLALSCPPASLRIKRGGVHSSVSTRNTASSLPSANSVRALASSSFCSTDESSATGNGWSTADAFAATLLAVAAAGSFIVTGPASRPELKLGRGGGGGGGPGGGGGGGAGPAGAPNSDCEGDESGTAFASVPSFKSLPSKWTNTTPVLGKSSKQQKISAPAGQGVLPKSYHVSVRALKGGRLSMEDEYYVADGGRFAAVFDGHGGGGVSSLLREKLYHTIEQHLVEEQGREEQYGEYEGGSHNTTGWRRKMSVSEGAKHPTPSIMAHVSAIRAAFQEIDKEILLNDSLQYQGSTAVMVALHEGDDGRRTLLSANVGDSRAILSRRGHAVDLTRDHKPNDEREKARILAMGETIEWDHYCKVHRVRNLSLSRALGDRFAKPAVSGEVEIKHFPVFDGGDEFILLASDGLWDVMTSQEVVSYVHKKLNAPPRLTAQGGMEGGGDMGKVQFTRRKNMSRFVANEALKRGSGDNVSVVIVWLQDLDYTPQFP